MGKKKAAIIVGAIAIAAAAAVGIWYFLGNGGKDSKDRVYVQKVSTIMGTATGVQNRYSGVVQPQKTVEVNADSERTVKEILVEVGDEVTEGTPLFAYDTEDLKMELEQAKLELENQDIEISNYRNQIQELDKERKAAAEGDKFEYTTQIQTIETQIKQAEYEKSSKNLEMDKIQKKIDNSQVTSTASGMVKTINDGNSQDQESSAFMTILSTGEYRIQGMANEQNVGMISSGADVIVRSRVDEDIIWTGTIDSLDTGEPSSEQDDMYGESDGMTSSSKYPFYVVMDDADGLMLGQHVLIELDEGQTEPREGIWLYSGYIVREGEEGGNSEEWMEDTEPYSDPEYDFDEDELYLDPESMDDGGDVMFREGDYEDADNFSGPADNVENTAMLSNTADDLFSRPAEDSGEGDLFSQPAEDSGEGDLFSQPAEDFGGDGFLESPEGYSDDAETDYDSGADTGVSGEGGTAYVWADDGNGRLEKRTVVLGEYDEELDEYEILSGLTEDDLIAWPMEGLYEGVKTVTDMDEVDYSSGLYNQENGTEGMSDEDYNMDNDWNDSDWEDEDWSDDSDWEDDEDWDDDSDWEDDDSDWEDDEDWDDGLGVGLRDVDNEE